MKVVLELAWGKRKKIKTAEFKEKKKTSMWYTLLPLPKPFYFKFKCMQQCKTHFLSSLLVYPFQFFLFTFYCWALSFMASTSESKNRFVSPHWLQNWALDRWDQVLDVQKVGTYDLRKKIFTSQTLLWYLQKLHFLHHSFHDDLKHLFYSCK